MNYTLQEENERHYQLYKINQEGYSRELMKKTAKIKKYELDDILENVKELEEPLEVSVPSVSDLNKLLRVMMYIHRSETVWNWEVGVEFNVSDSTAGQIINTGRYFGFIEKVNENKRSSANQLTEKGASLLEMNEHDRVYIMIASMLQFAPYRNTLLYHRKNNMLPTIDEVIAIMVDADVRYIYADSTFEKRAGVILSIMRWLLSNVHEPEQK